MNVSARRRALAIVRSSVLAGFTLMAPAFAATSGGLAATVARTAPAGPATSAGSRLQPGGTSGLTGPGTLHAGARNANANSTNWSGYVADRGTFMSASASWVEPAARCSSGSQYASFWVGLDGYASGTVEQIGSEADCSGKTARYYSWYELFPAKAVDFTNPVRPGDHLTGSVTYTGRHGFTLRLSDATRHWSHTVTGFSSKAARTSAEVIVEAPCCTKAGHVLPLADFGTVTFSGSAVNGVPLSSFDPVSVDIVSANGKKEDSISPLSSGQFGATWLNDGTSGGRTAGGHACKLVTYALGAR